MELISCPHCHTRVIPKDNRQCPACLRAVDHPADVPVEGPDRRPEGVREGPEDNPYRVEAAAADPRVGRTELPAETVPRTHRIIRALGLTNQVAAALGILLVLGSLWFLALLGIQGIRRD